LVLVLLPVATGSAQFAERLRLHVEGGAGGMLPEFQLDDLDYGLALLGAGRVGVELVDPLSIQASFAYWHFPSDAGAGEQLSFSGGLRVAPGIADVGRFFVDANAGLGRTGDKSRFALDIGLGFQFTFAREAVALGPFLRYGHLFATDQDHPSDAQYLVGGIAGAFGVPRSEELRRVDLDTDGDGVLDADDLCVDTPAGDTPDPERPGCPLGDQDADGVNDRDDVCPTVPQGETPDPERPGCPAADSDHDGVFDHVDPCPTTPQGEHPDPNRPGCPDADSDGDGVFDSADACPQVHQGLHPDPERPGCPLSDRDEDSVPDVTDACPDEPGAPSRDPARNGCPGLVLLEEGQLRITRPVYFATNRDTILARSRSVLEAVVDAIAATPGIRRISIEGHTDDVGDDPYNLDLSRRRANNVRQRLIESGIEAERLESHGYGETCPVVNETTRDARAQNRRVVFRIVDPPMSPPNPCPVPNEPAPETEE
jgi:outer membrane protein OmpA-like peptidoglycan-associated protein